MGTVAGMADPFLPTSLDHVALWVADRDALAALACDHLGMHEIERTDAFTLVGADARRLQAHAVRRRRPARAGRARRDRAARARRRRGARRAPARRHPRGRRRVLRRSATGCGSASWRASPTSTTSCSGSRTRRSSAGALAELGFERTADGVVGGRQGRAPGRRRRARGRPAAAQPPRRARRLGGGGGGGGAGARRRDRRRRRRREHARRVPVDARSGSRSSTSSTSPRSRWSECPPWSSPAPAWPGSPRRPRRARAAPRCSCSRRATSPAGRCAGPRA